MTLNWSREHVERAEGAEYMRSIVGNLGSYVALPTIETENTDHTPARRRGMCVFIGTPW